ncbi:MAG TPA: outer membrane beta-barrel protein [Puia sp.]|nr:outer membrane beta-barrel protein [Puia sp.]
MKKAMTFLFVSSFITCSVFSQTTKGFWLTGGNISFSTTKEHDNSAGASDLKTSAFTFAPDFGYFFINNFAAGINLSYITIHTSEGDNSSSANSFSAGPFARYYFGIGNNSKIFVQGNLAWGSQGYGGSQSGESISTYGFKAGPAFFLNPHVALELAVGYQSMKTKNDYYNYTTSDFSISAGFQIHLGKPKK